MSDASLSDSKGSEVDLSASLQTSPKVSAGILKNGFRYVLRPNAYPANRVYASIAVSAGSINETQDEQGLAHFLEHCVFLGTEAFDSPSKIEDALISLSMDPHADSNASTDFRETVYMAEAPAMLDYKELAQVFPRSAMAIAHGASASVQADAKSSKSTPNQIPTVGILIFMLHQLVFKASFSDQGAIAREKSAVLSEAALRHTLGSRVEAGAYLQIHAENVLPRRFPIGRRQCIERFGIDHLRTFYEKWYTPARMTLYICGSFDAAQVEDIVANIFGAELCENVSNLPLVPPDCPWRLDQLPSRDTNLNVQTDDVGHSVDNLSMGSDARRIETLSGTSTYIAERWLAPSPVSFPGGGFPFSVPIEHNFSHPPSQQILISQHPLLTQFSLMLTVKHKLQDATLATYHDFLNSTCDIVIAQILESRLNELRSSASRSPFKFISWDDGHSAGEGCSFGTLSVISDSGVTMQNATDSTPGMRRKKWNKSELFYKRERRHDTAFQDDQTSQPEEWFVWQEAVAIGIRECIRLMKFGVPERELGTALTSVGKAFRDCAVSADTVESGSLLDECIDAVCTGSAVLDARAEYDIFKKLQPLITTEKILSRIKEVFAFVDETARAAQRVLSNIQDMPENDAFSDLNEAFHNFDYSSFAEKCTSVPTAQQTILADLTRATSIFVCAPGATARTNLIDHLVQGDADQLGANVLCVPGVGLVGGVDPLALGMQRCVTDGNNSDEVIAPTDNVANVPFSHYRQRLAQAVSVADGVDSIADGSDFGIGVFHDITVKQVLSALAWGLINVHPLDDIHVPSDVIGDVVLQESERAFNERLTSCEHSDMLLNLVRPKSILAELHESIQTEAKPLFEWPAPAAVREETVMASSLNLEHATGSKAILYPSTYKLSNGTTLTMCPTPFEKGTIRISAVARGGPTAEGSFAWNPVQLYDNRKVNHEGYRCGTAALAAHVAGSSGAAGNDSNTLGRVCAAWNITGAFACGVGGISSEWELSSHETSGLCKVMQLLRAFVWHNHWDFDAYARHLDHLLMQSQAIDKSLEQKLNAALSYAILHKDGRFLTLSQDMINELSLEDAKLLFSEQFRPDNLHITIVGDFEKEKALDSTLLYLGSIPPHPKWLKALVEPLRTRETAQTNMERQIATRRIISLQASQQEDLNLDFITPDIARTNPFIANRSPVSNHTAIVHTNVECTGLCCSTSDDHERAIFSIAFPVFQHIPASAQVIYESYIDRLLGVEAAPSTDDSYSTVATSQYLQSSHWRRNHPMFMRRAFVLWWAILEHRIFKALRTNDGSCYASELMASPNDSTFISTLIGEVHATPLIDALPQAIGDAIITVDNFMYCREPITTKELRTVQGPLLEEILNYQANNAFWIGTLMHLHSHGTKRCATHMSQISAFYGAITVDDLQYAVTETYKLYDKLPMVVAVATSGLRKNLLWPCVFQYVNAHIQHRRGLLGRIHFSLARVWGFCAGALRWCISFGRCSNLKQACKHGAENAATATTTRARTKWTRYLKGQTSHKSTWTPTLMVGCLLSLCLGGYIARKRCLSLSS